MENAFGQPQNVVVFGGSSDIAVAIMQRLVRARARTVVLAGRNQLLLDQAAGTLRDEGATATSTVLFDAQDPFSAGLAVSQAFDQMNGPVDLVLIAVGALGHQFTDENDATASAQMATINFAWPVAALAEIRRRLVAQGSGRILVMSSAGAIRVRRGTYLYGGARAGLDRLCEGLADSLLGTGVTIQVVRPAFVRSKMTAGLDPTPFSTGVDQVADAVLKGLATNRLVIWSPALLRYVFMILRHLPAGLWRKLNGDR